MEQHHQICGGLTKQNKPCNITWGLDALGYCKYHTPYASQCRGIARSTGRRCRISWNLSIDGYCSRHQYQGAQDARQCIAIAQTTRQRCRISSGIDADGYCVVHRVRDVASPTCQGTLLNSSQQCTNEPKPGYEYCCAVHDPKIDYFPPSMFSSAVLTRELLEDQVVARYHERDLYHGDTLDLRTPGLIEMDHILEKQCFSYAFQFLNFRDDREDMNFVASIVRDEVVNELTNLCLTRTTTNRIKGSSVWKFLDDCITGHVGYRGNGATFTDYMMAENRDNMRLGRHTTRVITREMGSALKHCQRRFAAEGETPILDALSMQLQTLYVRMQLHTGSTHSYTKHLAKAKKNDDVLIDIVQSPSVRTDDCPEKKWADRVLNVEAKIFVSQFVPEQESSSAIIASSRADDAPTSTRKTRKEKNGGVEAVSNKKVIAQGYNCEKSITKWKSVDPSLKSGKLVSEGGGSRECDVIEGKRTTNDEVVNCLKDMIDIIVTKKIG
uniref:Uncharacterized protein n=1 Tax=Globisporangium ultimum (strain ATCC 200006 / CBS 805.95 / DAOM BR144) TaxID=431595 RepID=K3WR70_GLOUD